MSATTDAQDRIVKQLGDRYVMMKCSPQEDGSLHITAKRIGTGHVVWGRVVKIAPGGRIIHDSGEYEYDDYSDFADE